MLKSVFTWDSQLPQSTDGLSVQHPAALTYLPLLMQSHIKSFKYAGDCLVRCYVLGEVVHSPVDYRVPLAGLLAC